MTAYRVQPWAVTAWPADRFDITGSRWSVEGAEALLPLRAVIINGEFEEYLLHHIEQEHLRTRQARHQDGYALTA
ncbi:hypothetical protein ACFWBB_09830 [Streptomyces sp. NPDC060000]|uniref:hypothetical protein n=1 Tax=Streptomyces sp. NPDC060000 TaxID=3347031 RepID=UPI00369B0247